jgi:hypothetical protein
MMAVLRHGLHGGPNVTHSVTLSAFLGYCLLVVAGILAPGVLYSHSGAQTEAIRDRAGIARSERA